jgi:hypothetical protein
MSTKYESGTEYKIKAETERGKKVTFSSCFYIDGKWCRKWYYVPDGGRPEDRGSNPDQELGWEYIPLWNDIKITSIEKVEKPNE